MPRSRGCRVTAPRSRSWKRHGGPGGCGSTAATACKNWPEKPDNPGKVRLEDKGRAAAELQLGPDEPSDEERAGENQPAKAVRACIPRPDGQGARHWAAPAVGAEGPSFQAERDRLAERQVAEVSAQLAATRATAQGQPAVGAPSATPRLGDQVGGYNAVMLLHMPCMCTCACVPHAL